jgi:broad specificity phosphatase PhoE
MSSFQDDTVEVSDATEQEKVFYFVRHGKTFANEYLDTVGWDDPNFQEPEMWDTNLSHKGVDHSIATHEEFIVDEALKSELKTVEVVVASPLTRTMQTAHYLFDHQEHLLPPTIKRIAHPLIRERLYMSSDVGRKKHLLIEDFPQWDFTHVPDNEWWFVHDEAIHEPYVEWRTGNYLCKGESAAVFRERLMELRQLLLNRPESRILVVGHWGIFRGLTGLDFRNCQLRKLSSKDLLEEPLLDCMS